jgi:hypothetical protein
MNQVKDKRGRVTEDQGIKRKKTTIALDTNIQTRNIKIRTFAIVLKHGNPKHQIQGTRLWLVHL